MKKRKAASREDIEWAEAIAGGCMEMGGAEVTAEEALAAEEAFFREKIERAEEWERGQKEKREAAGKKAE